MRNKLSIWVHLVWSTKKREPLVCDELRPLLLHKVEEVAELKGYDVIEANTMPDHVHVLLRLHPSQNISDVVKHIKGITAHWINQQQLSPTNFEWQEGYGAFSVSSFMVRKVVAYIQNQQKNHTERDFENEMMYLDILGKDV
ncbi:IS200/IS605 family transposase [Oscillatoria amoena NRMC-F 0135]|nr:IS200/IS605 family transposase [Oscillatoria amoena NRMC-F 0135]